MTDAACAQGSESGVSCPAARVCAGAHAGVYGAAVGRSRLVPRVARAWYLVLRAKACAGTCGTRNGSPSRFGFPTRAAPAIATYLFTVHSWTVSPSAQGSESMVSRPASGAGTLPNARQTSHATNCSPAVDATRGGTFGSAGTAVEIAIGGGAAHLAQRRVSSGILSNSWDGVAWCPG